MQSSSESVRVAYCLPIGITSSKTKCVRLRNGRSLQHPKQISAWAMPLEGQFLCCALSVLAIALYKSFPQNLLVSSSFWSPRKRRHGPCIPHVMSTFMNFCVFYRCLHVLVYFRLPLLPLAAPGIFWPETKILKESSVTSIGVYGYLKNNSRYETYIAYAYCMSYHLILLVRRHSNNDLRCVWKYS